MRKPVLATVIAAVVLIVVMVVGGVWRRGEPQADAAQANADVAVALTGIVRSDAEGPMEGVVVSAPAARRDSPSRVSVVTDRNGRYAFPAAALQPGTYRLDIRAVGYDLDDPGDVDVRAGAAKEINLRVRPTKNLAAQLTNAEWLMSVPGTDEQKRGLNCVDCHTLQRVVESRHSVNEWPAVLHRMSTYYPGAGAFAVPATAIKLPYPVSRNDEARRPMAEYLASINKSTGGELGYPLKTLPRPTGRSTRALFTEFDLPRRDAQPHEVAVDRDGMVWYVDFAAPYIGMLNPRTGAIKEYEVPRVKAPEFPMGGTDIEFDANNDPWVSVFFQGAVMRFDRKTERFQPYSIPAKYNNAQTRQGMLAVPPKENADQRVWFSDNVNLRMNRLDPKTGEIDTFEAYQGGGTGDEYGMGRGGRHSIYGIEVDSQGNGWFSDIQGNNLGKIDARTGKSTLYPTPGRDAGPRRFWIDAQDRLWFAEYRGNKLGMFDIKTERFKEWPIATPLSKPYDVVMDRNGEVWGGGMWTDRVFRFDPKTETMTEYLLPSPTNTRRVDVDNTSARVAFWTGSNHGAKLVRVEPLD